MSDDDLNEQRTVQISGHQITLSDGRAVWAGHDKDSDSWFYRFIAVDGTETRLRLSNEATIALNRLIEMKYEPVQLIAEYVVKAIGDQQVDDNWRWEAVNSGELK